MEIFNETPYAFLPFDATVLGAPPALALIVKGAFKLAADQAAVALDKAKQPQMSGDEMFMDNIGRSLKYATDLAPFKLRGELTVTALCRSPRPGTKTCDVAIGLGPIHKTLQVSGDRSWPDASIADSVDGLPIRWERAFGGLALTANPMGRGLEPWPTPSGPVRYLPNVEYPSERVAKQGDRVRPAGFAPIAPHWSPRLEQQGTRDQRWATFRAPLPPDDFDPHFHQAAPADQQLADGEFFRGDERLTLTNLHPKLAEFRGQLPGKRLRLFVLQRQPGGAPSKFVEVPMMLDTVHVDAEAETVTLVWRKPVAVKVKAHLSFEAIYLAEEPLSEPAALPAMHEKRFRELRGPQEAPQAEQMKAEMDAKMNEAKRVLRDGGVDPEVIAEIDKMNDPQQVFDRLMKFVQQKTAEVEKLGPSFKG